MIKRLLKFLVISGLVLILLAAIPGCSSSAQPLETEADFTGFITEIHPGDPARLSVESHADKIVDKYVVTITGDTDLFRQEGEGFAQVNFDAFENKQWVRIWFSGPVMESFPMQVAAGQVVIIEAP